MNQYSIYCDYCGKKSIINKDKPNLVSIPLSEVPGLNKKLNRPPMFKCPKCGRGVVMKKVKEIKNADGNDKSNVDKTGFIGPSI